MPIEKMIQLTFGIIDLIFCSTDFLSSFVFMQIGMRKIKIKFVDFWKSFNPSDNYFINTLKSQLDIELSDEPDILFFSFFGNEHFKFNCHKILFLGENAAPDFRIADYAISFDYLQQSNHLRLPLYVTMFEETGSLNKLLLPKSPNELDDLIKAKEGFCSFVVSSKDTKSRIDFFHHLSTYKQVSSGGAVLNNVGGRVVDKLAFIAKYKFNIAFENAIYPGYVTEKLIEAKQAGTVPVYCGNPRIAEEMNPKSFINYHDYNSFKKLLERVKEVDNNDDLYKQYLAAPLFYNNQPNQYFNKDLLVNFFQQVVAALPTKTAVSNSLQYKITKLPLVYKFTKHKSRKNVIPYRPDW